MSSFYSEYLITFEMLLKTTKGNNNNYGIFKQQNYGPIIRGILSITVSYDNNQLCIAPCLLLIIYN